jgi:hypothetical protein
MKWLKRLFSCEPASNIKLVQDEKEDPCVGCLWKQQGRFQKCSCCRRNQNMKDNYMPYTGLEGVVERG